MNTPGNSLDHTINHSMNDTNQSTMSLGTTNLDASSIPPFELKKLVQQTLTLQKQVQSAQKAAHGKIISLQSELDTLTAENSEKDKKLKSLETRVKQLKKKQEDNQGLIAKLKPYKTKCQQLTVQNTELLQIIANHKAKKKEKIDRSERNDGTIGDTSEDGASINQPPTLSRSDSKASLKKSDSKHTLSRGDSRQSFDYSSTMKKSASSGSLTAAIANSMSNSSIINDFKVFNNALMDFLDAIAHLSIIDSCKIVYSMIIATQSQIESILDHGEESVLDALYNSHSNSEMFDSEKCNRIELRGSSFFQNFLKQFRQMEFKNLLDQEKAVQDIIATLQTEHPNMNIQDETYGSCIQIILPIIVNALMKGYKFKSNQQEELKGMTWDIAKYDLLNGGSDRGDEVTVVVRPALIRVKNGKEVRKPLVCCTIE